MKTANKRTARTGTASALRMSRQRGFIKLSKWKSTARICTSWFTCASVHLVTGSRRYHGPRSTMIDRGRTADTLLSNADFVFFFGLDTTGLPGMCSQFPSRQEKSARSLEIGVRPIVWQHSCSRARARLHRGMTGVLLSRRAIPTARWARARACTCHDA